jgi:hypothetical protein
MPLPMRSAAHHDDENAHHGHSRVPVKGDRIELFRTETGVRPRGTVYYADQLQILVKLDNGRSQSLRVGVDRYRVLE